MEEADGDEPLGLAPDNSHRDLKSKRRLTYTEPVPRGPAAVASKSVPAAAAQSPSPGSAAPAAKLPERRLAPAKKRTAAAPPLPPADEPDLVGFSDWEDAVPPRAASKTLSTRAGRSPSRPDGPIGDKGARRPEAAPARKPPPQFAENPSLDFSLELPELIEPEQPPVHREPPARVRKPAATAPLGTDIAIVLSQSQEKEPFQAAPETAYAPERAPGKGVKANTLTALARRAKQAAEALDSAQAAAAGCHGTGPPPSAAVAAGVSRESSGVGKVPPVVADDGCGIGGMSELLADIFTDRSGVINAVAAAAANAFAASSPVVAVAMGPNPPPYMARGDGAEPQTLALLEGGRKRKHAAVEGPLDAIVEGAFLDADKPGPPARTRRGMICITPTNWVMMSILRAGKGEGHFF